MLLSAANGESRLPRHDGHQERKSSDIKFGISDSKTKSSIMSTSSDTDLSIYSAIKYLNITSAIRFGENLRNVSKIVAS